MHSFFFFFLILFYPTALALIYNDKCTGNCQLPGLICVNNRCKCDSKFRLFWTGARCTECPNSWAITETACVTYYETPMSWENAQSKCRSDKSELISFPNREKILLIYNGTYNKDNKDAIYRAIGWTSARATDLSGLGKYEWIDKSIKSFNAQSDWWCKTSDTAALGYDYLYNEPTKLIDNYNNQVEECITYRRGLSNTKIICLDDRFCDLKFTFFCELSEYTAKLYFGAPLASTGNKDKKKLFLIILILAIVLLLILALSGLFFYLKRRKSTQPVTKLSDTNITETVINDEPIPEEIKEITPKKVDLEPQKPKRAGYSKQQFDEFD